MLVATSRSCVAPQYRSLEHPASAADELPLPEQMHLMEGRGELLGGVAVLEHLPDLGVLFPSLAVRHWHGGTSRLTPASSSSPQEGRAEQSRGNLGKYFFWGGKGNREMELVGDEVGEDMSKLKVFVGETVMSILSGANWLCTLLPIRP